MTTTSQKTALFLPSLSGGGAEKVMLNLAEGLARRGRMVDLVVASSEGEYRKSITSDIRLVDLSCKRTLPSLPNLIRYLRKERPSVLLSAIDHANVVAQWACQLAGVQTKTILTIHTNLVHAEDDKSSFKNNLMPFLIRTSYKKANHLIAVSKGVAEDTAGYLGVPAGKIEVIYNPVITPNFFDLSQERPEHPWFDDGGAPVILTVGRLSTQKDYPTLLKAFELVRKTKEVRLLVLGEGEERSSLEKTIQSMGIQSCVSMPGFVSNPYSYMKRASMVVLSSRAEGLPTMLIEALALGTPVVSSNCRSGPDEILQGGKWGQLVPVGDPHALAMGMIKALSLPRRTSEESYSRFKLDTVLNQYLNVFER